MRFLFVYPNVQRVYAPRLGISVLSAVLKEKGVETALFDSTMMRGPDIAPAFRAMVEAFEPDAVGFSVLSNEWALARDLLRMDCIKSLPRIVGGHHPTVDAEGCLAHCDYVVRGESEGALVELLDALGGGGDASSIPNVWSRNMLGMEVRNEMRELITDLDEAPIPDWNIFSIEHYTKNFLVNVRPGTRIVGQFEGSRGCPYQCTYCSSPHVMDMYKGKGTWRREKSPERMMREVKDFEEKNGLDMINWVDEIFLTQLPRLERLADLFSERVKKPFLFMERPEMVKEDKLAAIARAGAYSMSIGVESGDEQFRMKVLNRKMEEKTIIDSFRMARKHGIRTHAFNMVGLPYDNRDRMITTRELMKRVKPDTAQFSIFYPLVGTKLRELCEREGFLDPGNEMPENYYANSVLDMPTISKEDIIKYQTILEILCGRSGPWADFLWWLFETFPVTLVLRRRLRFLGEPVRYLETYGLAGSLKRVAFKLRRRFGHTLPQPEKTRA
ncbi:MAG: radical SAM protein [bacterium]|nr:radical SAM protein [bacterium]